MIFKFFPKEFNFFDLFEEQVQYAVDAADYFKKTVSNGAIDIVTVKKLQDIEHQSDDVSHAIIDQLNKTFITPFDREDIHALTKELDDITDMLNTIVSRLNIYTLHPDASLIEFASVIQESVSAVASAVKGLRNMKNQQVIMASCIEVNRLENVGDAMRDKAFIQLFETHKHDPIAVIKWKEIYQDAETVLDICEDVTHIIESIMVKQA